MSQPVQSLTLQPVGFVRSLEEQGKFEIQILPAYRPALQKLGEFSHVIVVWWADRHDNPQERAVLSAALPYAPGVTAGVFACRSEYRPNPLALTTMPILNVDEEAGVVSLPWIDALDGTPVLDLKPYIPCTDRVRDVHTAAWMHAWPEWMEDAGAYFAEHETDFGS